MKKLLFASLFMVLSVITLYGQDETPPPVKHSSQNKGYKTVMLGIKVSPNIGWFMPDSKDYKSEGVVFGFSWGFISDFSFTKNYSLSTGFNVIASNGKLNYPHKEKINNATTDSSGFMTRTYKLKYLEIPLTLKMRTRDFGKFTFYGQIGLGSAFNIRAKSSDEFTYGVSNATLSDEESIKNDVTLIRVGLILGIGTEFSLGGSTKLIAGFGYNGGLFDVLKGKNTVNNTIEQDAKQNLVEFSLGVLF